MDDKGSAIDFTCLETIAGLQSPGADDLLSTIISMYLKNSLALMQKLEAAVAADDRKLITETAHTLKSSSAQLGASRLSRSMQELEDLGRKGDTTRAPEILQVTQGEYAAAKTALEEILRSRRTV